MGLASKLPAWVRTTVRAARSTAERQDLIHEFGRRRGGEPSLPSGPIRRVMVICHGNICRSPFAEADLALRSPLLEVRSAGLEAADGDPAEPGARRVAQQLGLDLSDHASRRFVAGDIQWADLIIAMQGRHSALIARRWPGGARHVRLLGDYLPTPPHAIEDPWGLEDSVFHSVFTRIQRANERLSELLRSHVE